MNSIIEKLQKFIKQTDGDKSSHWKKHLENQDYRNIYSFMGFGNFLRKNLFKAPFHKIFLKYLFEDFIFKTDEFEAYKEVYDKMNRQIDVDAVRHVYTFNLLNKYKSPKKLCVIGDGKANFTLGSIKLWSSSQIFSINLAETLINDYLILKKSNLVNDEQIQVVENLNDQIDENKKIVLIPSSLKKILIGKKIDLFVNLVSFQEMTSKEIDNYFEIIKENKSLLYTCNREYKKLYGGEELIFKNYPWGNGKKIFYENCFWHQKFYTFKPPFIKKYDGNIMHCLIDYSV